MQSTCLKNYKSNGDIMVIKKQTKKVYRKGATTKPKVRIYKREFQNREDELSSPEWWAFSVMSDLQEALYMKLPRPRIDLYVNQIKQIIRGKYYTDGFTLQLVPQGQRQSTKYLEAEGFIYGYDVYGTSEEGIKAINKIDGELKPLIDKGRYDDAIQKINEIKRVLSPQKPRITKIKRKRTHDVTEMYSKYNDPRNKIPEVETTKEGWQSDIAFVNNKPYILVTRAGNLNSIRYKRNFGFGYLRDTIILKSKVGKSADPAYSDDLGYAYGLYVPMK
jgi:hypothetical protein